MEKPSEYQTSLLYLLLNGYKLNEKYYNCTDPKAIQGENVKQGFLGWYFLVTGIIFVVLYIPCVISGLRSDLVNTSCYKIMLCLSFFDIVQLLTNSVATGYYSLLGYNFCDSPKAIFTLGATGLGSWMGGCLTCVILAFNRCCDLNPNLKIRWIFIGKRAYFVLGLIATYGFYSIFLTKPLIFASEYVTWFFNPRINNSPFIYTNVAHTTNNCVVSACTTSLYTYLCVLLIHKSRHASSDSISKTQRQVFLQSIIICTFNAIAAYIYVYMQYFYSPPIVMLIGQIAWQWSNGSVCLVYLTMNRTIRNGVYEMMVPKQIRNRVKAHSHITPIRTQTNNRAMTSTSGNATIF